MKQHNRCGTCGHIALLGVGGDGTGACVATEHQSVVKTNMEPCLSYVPIFAHITEENDHIYVSYGPNIAPWLQVNTIGVCSMDEAKKLKMLIEAMSGVDIEEGRVGT